MGVIEISMLSDCEYEEALNTCRTGFMYVGHVHTIAKGYAKRLERYHICKDENTVFRIGKNNVCWENMIDGRKVTFSVNSPDKYLEDCGYFKNFLKVKEKELVESSDGEKVKAEYMVLRNKGLVDCLIGDNVYYFDYAVLPQKEANKLPKGFLEFKYSHTSFGWLAKFDNETFVVAVRNDHEIDDVKVIKAKKIGEFMILKAGSVYFAYKEDFRNHSEGNSIEAAIRNWQNSFLYKSGVNLADGVTLGEVKEKFGYCINGTKVFLKETMPFIYNQMAAYSQWESVPSEVLNTRHFVDIDNINLVNEILRK
jgi:ethanolamine utilization protein EutQ (cupin superfamily)